MNPSESTSISANASVPNRRSLDNESNITTTNETNLEPSMAKVLLVDDHSDIRRLVRITLGKTFEVLEAEDGTSALEIVRRQKPELVVLDIMMPGELDGLQVLDAIKADANLAATRVIMVTARGQAQDYEYGMQHGADAYFIKPFSPLALVSSIKEILAR
jgi:DNA-binding response OmpR family regulator